MSLIEAAPRTWMIVERLENWQVDAANDFRFFGIPERLAKRASEIQENDTFIVYVSSGVSAFSDIRKAKSSKVRRLRFGGDYDTPFPLMIETIPSVILPREKWIPIKEIINRLSFTKDKPDWRQVMRNALRVLPSDDASFISSRIQKASKCS